MKNGTCFSSTCTASPVRGVAADAGVALLDGEGAEAAQLHPVAIGERADHLLEDGVHDPLDVALVEVRIVVGDLLDQLGSDHLVAPSPETGV